jgi:hypothetical protein
MSVLAGEASQSACDGGKGSQEKAKKEGKNPQRDAQFEHRTLLSHFCFPVTMKEEEETWKRKVSGVRGGGDNGRPGGREGKGRYNALVLQFSQFLTPVLLVVRFSPKSSSSFTADGVGRRRSLSSCSAGFESGWGGG